MNLPPYDGAEADALLAGLPTPSAASSHGLDTSTPGGALLADMLTSGGAPHEIPASMVSATRTHLNTHFWDFAFVIGGCNILYPDLHGPVCQLMERWGTPGWKRVMVQLPRGTLKSTVFTRTGALWKICQDPNNTVVIFNEKVERVEKWLLAIQSIVAGNPLFYHLYRDIIPPGVAKADTRTLPKSWKWSSREMTFVRDQTGIPEASITAMSVGGASAGGHWKWIFHDDLISVEARDSQVVMKSVKDWADTSVYLGPSPELLNAWVGCTRWRYDDVYEYLHREHDFKLYRRAAIENGETCWPASSNSAGLGWSTEWLLKEQAAHPVAFSGQMMNEPMAGEDTTIKPSHIRGATITTDLDGAEWLTINEADYDPKISVLEDEEAPRSVLLSRCNRILLVDPAPSTESERKNSPNARTAQVMKLIDPWGRRFTVSIWAGREGPEAEIRRMLAKLTEWGTDRIGIEEVVFSIVYRPFLNYIARAEGHPTPRYIGLKPGRREKGLRLNTLARSYAEGFEYVLESERGKLMEEAIPYPYGRTVDILDASAYDRDPGVLPRPETDGESWGRESRAYTNWRGDDGRDSLTGY